MFFGIVGATLLLAGSRAERRPGLLAATLLVGLPGALLVTPVGVSVVRFFIGAVL